MKKFCLILLISIACFSSMAFCGNGNGNEGNGNGNGGPEGQAPEPVSIMLLAGGLGGLLLRNRKK